MGGIWGALLSSFVGAEPIGIRSSGGLPAVYLSHGHCAVVFGHFNFLLSFFCNLTAIVTDKLI